ncbi:hypothetical protein SDC9_81315 [bioreactor metagenome]|uniref:Uncharacterized protein n=1 Tax=bioreactor metagenome TaxID=1076179 RepID=A0A644Z377_9ZZZZ
MILKEAPGRNFFQNIGRNLIKKLVFHLVFQIFFHPFVIARNRQAACVFEHRVGLPDQIEIIVFSGPETQFAPVVFARTEGIGAKSELEAPLFRGFQLDRFIDQFHGQPFPVGAHPVLFEFPDRGIGLGQIETDPPVDIAKHDIVVKAVAFPYLVPLQIDRSDLGPAAVGPIHEIDRFERQRHLERPQCSSLRGRDFQCIADKSQIIDRRPPMRLESRRRALGFSCGQTRLDLKIPVGSRRQRFAVDSDFERAAQQVFASGGNLAQQQSGCEGQFAVPVRNLILALRPKRRPGFGRGHGRLLDSKVVGPFGMVEHAECHRFRRQLAPVFQRKNGFQHVDAVGKLFEIELRLCFRHRGIESFDHAAILIPYGKTPDGHVIRREIAGQSGSHGHGALRRIGFRPHIKFVAARFQPDMIEPDELFRLPVAHVQPDIDEGAIFRRGETVEQFLPLAAGRTEMKTRLADRLALGVLVEENQYAVALKFETVSRLIPGLEHIVGIGLDLDVVNVQRILHGRVVATGLEKSLADLGLAPFVDHLAAGTGHEVIEDQVTVKTPILKTGFKGFQIDPFGHPVHNRRHPKMVDPGAFRRRHPGKAKHDMSIDRTFGNGELKLAVKPTGRTFRQLEIYTRRGLAALGRIESHQNQKGVADQTGRGLVIKRHGEFIARLAGDVVTVKILQRLAVAGNFERTAFETALRIDGGSAKYFPDRRFLIEAFQQCIGAGPPGAQHRQNRQHPFFLHSRTPHA